ncbi:MAG TPA: ROK family transcriptional regulator [Roseateles sp.]|nr:ROK family transcriptional regulator [Roseateles sp.]
MHAELAKGGQQLLKVINRMTVVRHLCANPGASRSDLAAAVGLTKSTVSSSVRDLINRGWLVERDNVATGDMGRRPTPLFIDESRLLLLGAEVDIESLRVVATSLTGEIQATVIVEHGVDRSAAGCIERLSKAMLQLLTKFRPERQVVGIGVGLPGSVQLAGGIVQFAPNLGWRNVPFAALLTAALRDTALSDSPLFVQNEADVAALGELEFNPSPGGNPLIYVSINQGLGAGVIVGDRLLNGSRGYAGEVGHMVLQFNGPRCSCGRRGCAEALIATGALLRGQGQTDALSSLDEVRQRLKQRDPATSKAVASAGHHLGMLLLNLTAAYDPGCIVLGGAAIEIGDAFLHPALATLNSFAVVGSAPQPVVRTSRFGANAVAIGAAALVRYRVTRPALPSTDARVVSPVLKETV